MKRILSILCCVLILGAMRLSAQTVEVTIDNIKYSCTGTTAEVSGYGTEPAGALVIPNEVTTDGNTYTVTSIGNSAFYSCLVLTSIELPASLTSIGNNAFYGCSRLTSIELPASLTAIGYYAFRNCWGLISVISRRTTPIAISSNVFDNVHLKVLSIPEGGEALVAYQSADVWKSFGTIVQGKPIIQVINGIKYLCNENEAKVLGYETEPTGVLAIPSEVTTDGNTYTVTSIGNNAFFNCSGLTSIELPASLTSIGNSAFYYCSKLTLVISLRTTPIAISSNVFDNVSSKVLSIPEGGEVLAAYQSADVWKDFGTIVQGKPIDLVINGIKYLCYENEAKVIGYETEPTGVLAIPSEVTTGRKTYTVTSIGYYAFSGCSGLTSIELPASLTSIGEGAFSNCSGLTSIELPASLTSIGKNAFYYCSGLTSIELPASLTSIGNEAFYGCSGLTSIELPASLTSIGEGAFSNCSGLTSIELPASLTSIGKNAFAYCSELISVISLRTTPIAISADVFDNVHLKVLSIPEGGEALVAYQSADVWKSFGTIVQGKPIIQVINGIKYLCNENEAKVIGYETKPTGVLAIPSEVTTDGNTYTVTSIGNYAFYYCSGLTSIELPASLTSIGNSAFSDCYGLTLIELPASLTAIGNYAFSGCRGLTSIELPASLTAIGNYAFSGCRGLTSIELPASLTAIGNYAFRNCSGLTSIELPASLTAIGNSAFYDCSKLTSVTSLRITPIAISADVFDNVSSKRLYIPEGGEALSAYQSADVWKSFGTIVQGKPIIQVINGIKYLCYENEAKVLGYETEPTGVLAIPSEVTTDGNTYTVTSIGNYAFYYCSGLTSIELPASLTSIGNSAFSDCYGLTLIELPASLTAIGNAAFYYCSELTSIELPASLTAIGDKAFYRCSKLTSIELPASLTAIGDAAFFDCEELTSIELPASLTSIGNDAFYRCSKLTLVTSLRTTPIAISADVFNDVSSKVLSIPEGGEALAAYQSADVWKDFGTIVQGKPIIQVTNGIKYLCNENEAKVIGYETMLTGVLAIPSEVTTDGNTYTVTSIGDYAFMNCWGLTSIGLPASLTSIGNYAFRSCTGLTSIGLPASLTSIGDYAFRSCTGLTSIGLPASLTSIGDYAFYGCFKLTDIIYWGITEPLIGTGIVSSEIELWLPNASAGFTASNWKASLIHYGRVPVSVSSLESEELRCYASQQEIVVTSSQNLPLTITNLYGVTIYSGKTIDGTTRVSVTQSGVYIVRVGLKSFKVVVQ